VASLQTASVADSGKDLRNESRSTQHGVISEAAKSAPQDGNAPLADPQLLTAQARVGTVLGNKWRLDAIIGIGGMAAVYAATHRNGSRAAVKVLHADLSNHATIQQRFLYEGHVANSVGHPGAVKILDDDVAEDGSLFLVTELLAGETLDERRVRVGGRLPADEVLRVTDQILDVLSAAHAHGIVHRDLKPENVFLTRAGQVKVLDFGIARMRGRPGPALTEPGMTMGTPCFMSPEHASGLEDEVDERTDIWSCGALMFNLLSGALVHDGRTPNEQLVHAMTNRAAPITSVLPEIAVAVASVVDRALAFDKKDRWPDATTMRQAVREAHQTLGGVPMTEARALEVSGGEPRLSSIAPLVVLPPVKRPWSALAAQAAAMIMFVSIGTAGASLFGMRNLVSKERGPAPNAAEIAPRTADAPATVPRDPAPLPSSAAPMVLPATGSTVSPAAVSPRSSVSGVPKRPTMVGQQHPQGTSAAPTSAFTHGDCRVPYFIDIDTGKKRWKLDCL
jgi:serine/threonine protein kinase